MHRLPFNIWKFKKYMCKQTLNFISILILFYNCLMSSIYRDQACYFSLHFVILEECANTFSHQNSSDNFLLSYFCPRHCHPKSPVENHFLAFPIHSAPRNCQVSIQDTPDFPGLVQYLSAVIFSVIYSKDFFSP